MNSRFIKICLPIIVYNEKKNKEQKIEQRTYNTARKSFNYEKAVIERFY
jgi:hypothetical protein